MAESQAIGRVHRFGQKERVTVTRYIVRKSIESVCLHPFRFVSPVANIILFLIVFSMSSGSRQTRCASSVSRLRMSGSLKEKSTQKDGR